MISVQRVSTRYAAESRAIGSADMSGSKYAAPIRDEVQVVREFMQASGLEPDDWQVQVMIRALTTFARHSQPASQPSNYRRNTALAAKAARGTGPPLPVGWRGRERTTIFRSQ